MKKKFVLFIALFFSLMGTATTSIVSVMADDAPKKSSTTLEKKETAFQLDAKAGIAVDFETGKILYQQNENELLGIASMTKMISIYVVLDAIKDGKLHWEDTVKVPDYLIPVSQNFELSNVPLYENISYTVKELYEASLIASANAAVTTLAYAVAGDEGKFVTLMKEKLKSIGIKDAKIVNSSGLNNSYLKGHIVEGTKEDDENYLSAKDVAILVSHLLKDYPEILETTKIPQKTFGAKTGKPYPMINWNWMLPGLSDYKKGVDGLKTGTTDIAGACFAGTRLKDGHRMITVVMHANQHEKNHSARFIETSRLLDYVDETWEYKTLEPADFSLKTKTLPVARGKQDSVSLTIKEKTAPSLWLKDQEQPKVKETIQQSMLQDNGKLLAPIEKGTKVGTLSVTATDDLGYLEKAKQTPTLAIVTAEGVEKGSITQQIKEVFQELWEKITHIF